MSDAPPARPRPPSDSLESWVETEDIVENVFSLASVRIVAHTVVFEDRALREAIQERTSVDGTWRFFFATRLGLRPTANLSRALRKLVTNRAKEGFVDRLRERGFDAIEQVESRAIRIDDGDAGAFRYEGRCRVEGVTLSIEGWLAVRPVDGEFLLTGGAYPTGVVTAGDTTVEDALRSLFRPAEYRAELFELIRKTE